MITNKPLEEIIAMDNDDLRELLLDEHTNSQELRELIYRLIHLNKTKDKQIQLYSKIVTDLEKQCSLYDELVKDLQSTNHRRRF